MGEIKLTDVIAPAFYGVHWDIIDEKHTYYDLFGGRGSTKSSFIGTEIPLGMMQDAVNGIHSNAVVFRKVGNTLRESVFEQIAWGIDALGATDEWTSSLREINESSYNLFEATTESEESGVSVKLKVGDINANIVIQSLSQPYWHNGVNLKKLLTEDDIYELERRISELESMATQTLAVAKEDDANG